MTKAKQFIIAWQDQLKTISTKSLAVQMDPDVEIRHHKSPDRTLFTFSDGSEALVTGRGRNFQIQDCQQ